MGKFEETKKKMINTWRGGKPEDCDDDEVELTESQLIRLDNMYNAAHDLCVVITEEPDLEFDMYYAGTIVEFAVMLLLERGNQSGIRELLQTMMGHPGLKNIIPLITYRLPKRLAGLR